MIEFALDLYPKHKVKLTEVIGWLGLTHELPGMYSIQDIAVTKLITIANDFLEIDPNCDISSHRYNLESESKDYHIALDLKGKKAHIKIIIDSQGEIFLFQKNSLKNYKRIELLKPYSVKAILRSLDENCKWYYPIFSLFFYIFLKRNYFLVVK